jgi:hypothetical protein
MVELFCIISEVFPWGLQLTRLKTVNKLMSEFLVPANGVKHLRMCMDRCAATPIALQATRKHQRNDLRPISTANRVTQ